MKLAAMLGSDFAAMLGSDFAAAAVVCGISLSSQEAAPFFSDANTSTPTSLGRRFESS
jgi:hypothetical protein